MGKIEELDESALSIARAWHFRANMPDPDPVLERTPGDCEPVDGLANYERFPSTFPTKEEWVDIATLCQLRASEHALVRPAEIAIGLSEGTLQGADRPPELAARAVALTVARALLDLTRKRPTYRRDGTAYARLTATIFEFLGEKANTDRACKWALTKLTESGEFHPLDADHNSRQVGSTKAKGEAMTHQDLLTEAKYAELRGVSVRTVHRERMLRCGPPFIKLGKAVFYRPAAVDAWLLTQESSHRPAKKSA